MALIPVISVTFKYLRHHIRTAAGYQEKYKPDLAVCFLFVPLFYILLSLLLSSVLIIFIVHLYVNFLLKNILYT